MTVSTCSSLLWLIWWSSHLVFLQVVKRVTTTGEALYLCHSGERSLLSKVLFQFVYGCHWKQKFSLSFIVETKNLNIRIRIQESTYLYTKLERSQRNWEIKRPDGLHNAIRHQECAQKKQKVSRICYLVVTLKDFKNIHFFLNHLSFSLHC